LLKASADRNRAAALAGLAESTEPTESATLNAPTEPTESATLNAPPKSPESNEPPGLEGAASHGSAPTFMQRFQAQYLNRHVVGGYTLLLVAMVIPLYALKFIDLKYAAIFESLGYVFIMVLSAIFLHERVTRRLIVGNILIIAGVIMFGSHIIP
jgi:multidrug transporter EmrE-like cation transporter